MNTSTGSQGNATLTFFVPRIFERIKNEGLLAVLLYISAKLINALIEYEISNFINEHNHILIPGTNNRRYVRYGYHKVGLLLYILVCLFLLKYLELLTG